MPHLDRGSRPFQEGAALLRFRTAVRSVSEAEIMRRMAPARTAAGPRCRRKVEMSPDAQSRDDTPVGGGDDERDGITTKP